ncbi:hypothetical protein WA026_003012 [Henosepilachna vigintioctopunctata]|uniref:Uncharacterized protein n=1 Tax=Henosepilachna vigintioctopunctata TaxID=420089 RepID=A0AAW1TH20_9CUCU
MYRRYPVLPLRYLSLIQFLETFIDMISRPRINRLLLREYISYASNRVLETSLRIILSDRRLRPHLRFRTLEIMLRQDVSRLNVGIFPLCYHERILRIIIEQGTGLRHLNISDVSVRNNALLLFAIVRAAPNLRVLVVPDMGLNRAVRPLMYFPMNILNMINENLLGIPLDLIYFPDEPLHIADIINPRRGEFSMRHIFELNTNLTRYLSSLREVNTYSNCVLSVRSIYNTQLRLIVNLIYLIIAITIYDVIVQLCQQLEMIYLNFPGRNNILSFMLCNFFIRIRFMMILRDIFTIHISNSNSNLRMIEDNLTLCGPLHAPNMRSIVNSQSSRMYIEMSNPHTFPFLTDIELVDCNITDDNVILILINIQFLMRVLIGCDVSLRDEDMDALCQRCSFKYLKELRLSSASNLTRTSVEILFLFCGMKLTIIGNMNGWGVTSEEIEEFQELMRLASSDLTLVYSENDI